MFVVLRNVWAYLFNNDPEVVALCATILPVVALFQVFDGLGAITGGILRAQGKQFTGALLNLRCVNTLIYLWYLTLTGFVYQCLLRDWHSLRHLARVLSGHGSCGSLDWINHFTDLCCRLWYFFLFTDGLGVSSEESA